MPHDQIRVAIADDHALFRDGLRRLLETEPGVTVVGEARDGVEAVRVARDTSPDVMLLDIAMPRLDGLHALSAPELRRTKVIVLTASTDEQHLVAAVEAGARGVVLKEQATRVLLDGIRTVAGGGMLIGSETAAALARSLNPDRGGDRATNRLTPRESEIVGRIGAGRSNRQIASELGITLQTVKHHLTNIFDKTSTSSRLELGVLAATRRLQK